MATKIESLWSKTASLSPVNRHAKEKMADVIVIGGGMAGLLTAYRLQSGGLKTIVLEAGKIAGGQTKNTTAKITSQHGCVYDALLQTLGEKKAGQYARANESAICEYGKLVETLQIPCDFRHTCAYLYTQIDAKPMELEAQAAKKLGMDASFTRETELPFDVAGAVCFEGQAQFHPLRFLQGIVMDLEIYEDTPVLTVEENRVETERGEFTAEQIVFATHYPMINVPGWYFMRMHQERAYVLALKSPWLPRGMYYGVDQDGLSFREANGLLLLGGENHRTGENSAGGRYERLLRRAEEIVPGFEEKARWSAQDCITLDGVPYIGKYSNARPSWYVATGFHKWGMTGSMVAALLIGGQILGKEPEWAEVFSPSRFLLSASAKNIATNTVQAVKGLARQTLSLPETALSELPMGHGGIVEIEGQKIGVYKDLQGRCFSVEPVCPHLGCQLEWNPDELSWDCPCHGSRFSYEGALIDNPAQTDIQ
ncbi:MAG: FAD-dependent oxidoreductase [Eubacteriales bacterium]|nr:FAD-dependent oxidoreductase [Eubacteriales bacterium]